MANPVEAPLTQPAPGKPEDGLLLQQPVPTFPAPTFYITSRQMLSPKALLLAIIAAAGAVAVIPYVLGRAMAARAHSQQDADDPDQVDVIVIGDPGEGKAAARHGDHVSDVHPTILVHLPRFGSQMGYLPNSPAGHLLYDWLAAFNQGSYPALADALPLAGLPSATAAQLELRRNTGGFSLLSAKEVEPGTLVFRMSDQTPDATQVLGTLQVRPNSNPAAIASFTLLAVPSPRGGTGSAHRE